jgi:hypothetical protein
MFVVGYSLGARTYPVAISVPSALVFVVMLFFGRKQLEKKFEELENEKISFRKGAVGEAVIGGILEGFPDDYAVIHDLTTAFGNIDHFVIGPSGAYVIDTKNWKGTVSADGNGELLLNGKPTDKQEIRKLTRTIMDIQKKVHVLSSLDPFVQGVLAFPSAFVEARWGTTGHVHCVRDDQLYDYIVENKRGKRLSRKEVDSISQAFMALARMDKDFGDKGQS